MSKYLDITGLREFWSKTKEYIYANYKSKDRVTSNGGTHIMGTDTLSTSEYFIDSLSQNIDGVISATAKRAKIPMTGFASSSHDHGSLTSGGNLNNEVPTDLSGYSLAIRKSGSGLLRASGITFSSDTPLKLLSKQGDWVNRPNKIYTDAGLYDSRYKTIQTPVDTTDPYTVLTDTEYQTTFLSSLSQDANGDITPTYKTFTKPDITVYADAVHSHGELVRKADPWMNGNLVIAPPSDFPLYISSSTPVKMIYHNESVDGEAQITIRSNGYSVNRAMFSAHRSYWGPNMAICFGPSDNQGNYPEMKLGITGTYGLPYWWFGDHTDITRVNEDGLYYQGLMAWLAVEDWTENQLGSVLEELQQL